MSLNKIKKIKNFKSKKKLVCLTAYSKSFTKILDQYCDIILVGDSVATAFYGMKNTKNISLETMINHAISVKKYTTKSLLVFDMPFNTYNNIQDATKNVKYILKRVKCDAFKIESNGRNLSVIKKLVKLGIPIMGHIGYTPQFKSKFKAQGLKEKEIKNLIDEAKGIEEAGAFSIVLECVRETIAKKITSKINIPTIGIGSSKYCDGQILVTDDLIGMSGFYPKFVKKYINLQKLVKNAVKRYRDDVRKKKFPNRLNSYN